MVLDNLFSACLSKKKNSFQFDDLIGPLCVVCDQLADHQDVCPASMNCNHVMHKRCYCHWVWDQQQTQCPQCLQLIDPKLLPNKLAFKHVTEKLTLASHIDDLLAQHPRTRSLIYMTFDIQSPKAILTMLHINLIQSAVLKRKFSCAYENLNEYQHVLRLLTTKNYINRVNRMHDTFFLDQKSFDMLEHVLCGRGPRANPFRLLLHDMTSVVYDSCKTNAEFTKLCQACVSKDVPV